MKDLTLYAPYFQGQHLTPTAEKTGYLTWADISRGYQMILANSVVSADPYIWEDMANTWPEDEDGTDYYPDVYQHWIIEKELAEFLLEYADVLPGTLYYSRSCDLWVLGTTWFGLSWELVSTGIKIVYPE